MNPAPIEVTTAASPTAAVIWLHGLGADGNDFAPIVPQLELPQDLGIRFIFPHAPMRAVTCNGGYVMRAWYDIYALGNLDREDAQGLDEAQQIISGLIANENERGIETQNIVLMGFSQGGAVALHSGLAMSQALAGIGALSTYLPLQETFATRANPANAHTPVFMAHGTYDPVVSHTLGEQSRDLLNAQGYEVQWHEYPMEHNVCVEEISDISSWLSKQLDT